MIVLSLSIEPVALIFPITSKEPPYIPKACNEPDTFISVVTTSIKGEFNTICPPGVKLPSTNGPYVDN